MGPPHGQRCRGVSGGEASGCCPSSSGNVPSLPGCPLLGANRGFYPTGSVPGTQEGDVAGPPCPGSVVWGGCGRRLCSSSGVSSPPAPSLPSSAGPSSCTWPCWAPRQPAPGSAGWGWDNSVPPPWHPPLPPREVAGRKRTPRPGGSAGSPGRVPPRGAGAEPRGCSAPAWGLQEERGRDRTQQLRGFGEGAWLPSASLKSPLGGQILCCPSLRLGEMLWLPSSPVGTLSPRAPRSSRGAAEGRRGPGACVWAPGGDFGRCFPPWL